ncbi:MAG TPA: GNAT family N-acetyltransferase [Candidatus Solibacter sp.]|nr:GNAT family N-acetyltransferase [Candidatus Solibacter sp.]
MIQKEKITLRPAGDGDETFLLSVYASTRADELAQVPWSAEQKDTFLRMQFSAQKQHYAAQYPQARHDIIYLDQTPMGRLYLDRQAEGLHILDITILSQYRNSGIGSFLLGRIMDEARDVGKSVTIYVESFNPSLRLFERLGFRKDAEHGFQFLMKWSPSS